MSYTDSVVTRFLFPIRLYTSMIPDIGSLLVPRFVLDAGGATICLPDFLQFPTHLYPSGFFSVFFRNHNLHFPSSLWEPIMIMWSASMEVRQLLDNLRTELYGERAYSKNAIQQARSRSRNSTREAPEILPLSILNDSIKTM